MNKILAYLAFIFISSIVAAIYGVVHDQISYTLSEEYFTKFKFIQFNVKWAYEQPRIGAAYVGVLASWWMGAVLSSLLGIYGFFFINWQSMLTVLLKTLAVVIVISALVSSLGIVYGYYMVTEETYILYEEYLRVGVTNPVQFLRAGFMHNASYAGGLAGLLFGFIYLYITKRRL